MHFVSTLLSKYSDHSANVIPHRTRFTAEFPHFVINCLYKVLVFSVYDYVTKGTND